jgi:sulfide:quinone oxidoreductase
MDARRPSTRGPVGQPADHAADLAAIEGGLSRDHLQPPRRRRRGPADFEEIERPPRGRDRGRYLPVTAGKVQDEDAEAFGEALTELPGPVLAYCRTGTRSATLWSLAKPSGTPLPTSSPPPRQAGYDMGGVVRRIANGGKTPTDVGDAKLTSSSSAAGPRASPSPPACSRKPGLEIAIIDPADIHYYQPGWTMVGGGIFEPRDTAKTMGSLIPRACTGSRPPSPPSSPRTTPSSSMAAGW